MSTDQKLFGRYTLADLAVAAVPGVLVALTIQLVVPQSTAVAGVPIHALTVPAATVAVAVGALFVYLTPQYVSSIDWVIHFVEYATDSNRYPHESATELTQVERIFPDHDAVERTDGAVVGMVAVEPPTMALATTAEWAQTTESFRDFLNTTVEFPIQLYSTTRPFPAADHAARYTERLDDDDVDATPVLADLIEGYVEWHVENCDARPMTIRDHYVVVPVTPAEVQFEESRFVEQLAALPFVGVLLRAAFAQPRAVERQTMLAALDDRLRRVTTGLREMRGCDAHRVSAETATRVIGEYWCDHTPEYEDFERAVEHPSIVASAGDAS